MEDKGSRHKYQEERKGVVNRGPSIIVELINIQGMQEMQEEPDNQRKQGPIIKVILYFIEFFDRAGSSLQRLVFRFHLAHHLLL